MPDIPLIENFLTPGAKDALNTASGSLPPNGAPLTLTLDFEMKSKTPHYVCVSAQSSGNIAAAYSFSGNLKFYDENNNLVLEHVLAAHTTLINKPVRYQNLLPVPGFGIRKAVYVATYVSGVDPAGVNVEVAFVPA